MNTLAILSLTYAFNALWQLPLVYVAAHILAHIARPASPDTRHRLWVGALALEIALPAPLPTLADRMGNVLRALAQLLSHASSPGRPRVSVLTGPGSVHGTLGLPHAILITLTALYLLLTSFFLARLLWRFHQTQRLRSYILPAPITPASAARWRHLCQTFCVPNAHLALSTQVCGPVTLGIRHRLLLLPPDFAASLPEEDLDAALAHEFAHMARRDFAKNFAYQALSVPIAFHPILQLTLAHLAASREIVCDARAAQSVAGPQRYANSLLRLAAALVPGQPSANLHTIGIFDAHTPHQTLETRLMNLTAKPTPRKTAFSLVLGLAATVLILGTCASALALHLQVATPLEAGATSSSQQTARVSGGVMAGNVLTKVPPVYPPDAKEAKVTGAVVLHALIGKDGTVQKLTVVSGPEQLRDSALDAVHQWTYKPYLLNGNPVEVDTVITVTYSLSN